MNKNEKINLGKRNICLLATGIALVIIGYIFMSLGDRIISPILLILGYAVIIPLSLLLSINKNDSH